MRHWYVVKGVLIVGLSLFALVSAEDDQEQRDEENHSSRDDVGRDEEGDPRQADEASRGLERLEDVVQTTTRKEEGGSDLGPFAT